MRFQMEEAIKRGQNLSAFNILTLGMQVVDDNVYMCRYINFLLQNSEMIIKKRSMKKLISILSCCWYK